MNLLAPYRVLDLTDERTLAALSQSAAADAQRAWKAEPLLAAPAAGGQGSVRAVVDAGLKFIGHAGCEFGGPAQRHRSRPGGGLDRAIEDDRVLRIAKLQRNGRVF